MYIFSPVTFLFARGTNGMQLAAKCQIQELFLAYTSVC